MNEGIDLSELDDQPAPTDFRRANGAPLVRSLDGKKWERYSRPSSWGHDLDDESALNLWKIDRAIEGVATTPSLAASIAAHIGEKEGRGERREKAIQIGRGEEAADLGTALHAMAHRLERDPGFRAPEPHASDLAAYLMAIDQAGLESTHCEVHVACDVWRAAGTPDRIYRCRRELALPDGSVAAPGTSFIGDLKTGKRLDYSLPGYAIQLAVYADGCFYDVATDERTPFPDQLHTGWGVLVHLPVGQATATLLWVDLEVGRVGARLVQGVRAWRKRDDFAAPFIFPTSDEVAVLQSGVYDLEHPVLDVVEGSENDLDVILDLADRVLDAVEYPVTVDGATFILDEPDSVAEEWLEAMLPWAQERINQIGCLPEPRALLLRRWPESVPPLRGGDVTASQLAQVLDLLDAVEAAFSLPFPAGDPRVGWNQGRHHDVMLRGNQPSNPAIQQFKE